jgi:hypothetical protein|tara:strand:+ start:1598 stop:2170 length:573 start_codon:yes stop_codon:yes gene_type:complete
VTARWVVDEVAAERDLSITWQPISLLFKNEPPEDTPYYESTSKTHKMLRVMEAVKAGGQENKVFDLYWEFGSRIHHDGDRDFDIADALATVGLAASYAEAASDEKWDIPIREKMDDGLSLVGDDVGTPIIAWNRSDGDRVALFGPVITRVPQKEDALKLWDAMTMLGDVDGFWELKKTRTERPEFGDRPT